VNAPEQIEKNQPDPDGLDFDALRKSGLTMLQALAGENWTDYNLHDPGVTILEQLCYGLTDLAYRSEFAPEDYLAGSFGQIDYARHALHPADQILPSQVLTGEDYRKLLYDSIPEIEDVWVSRDDAHPADQASQVRGLYHFRLKLRDSVQDDLSGQEQQALEQRVIAQVVTTYHAHRNLGEDLGRVSIMASRQVYLQGDIQIHSLRDAALIFADIFFRCALQLMSGLRIERYLEASEAGASLAEIFEGPLTVHGRVVDADGLPGPGAAVSLAKLIALVQGVDGVTHVQRLSLCDEAGRPVRLDGAQGEVLRLRFPEPAQSHLLRLHFASGAVGHDATAMDEGTGQQRLLQQEKDLAMLAEAREALRKVRFEFDTLRNTHQPREQIVPAPTGVARPLRDYYSIQHQFPAIYGINRFGVPASAPLHRKVSARQLKAYLFLAEQLMANYLADLQEIPSLFSLDDLTRTYSAQVLDDEALPGIEALYAAAPAQIADKLARIVAHADHAEHRRNRLLDVLLAMYGEDFSQKSLRRFNFYQDHRTAKWVMDNKLAFMRRIVGLSRDRATAVDLTRARERTDGSPNIAGVQAKICILLDLPLSGSGAALSDGLLGYRLRLASDEKISADHYAGIARHVLRLARTERGPLPAAAAPDSPNGLDGLDGLEQPGKDQPAWHAMPGGAPLPQSLLTQGVRLDNYILEQNGQQIHVRFQTHDPRLSVVRLASYAALDEAEAHIQHLRDFICQLNLASEGVHLVEHLLLRPRGAGAAADGPQSAGPLPQGEAADFYGHRISVIFPAWTARFADLEFRLLAQETVSRNLPAHLFPEFFWLDFVAMRDFEQRQRLWRERLRHYSAGEDGQALEQASASMVSFLLRQRAVARAAGRSQPLYWV